MLRKQRRRIEDVIIPPAVIAAWGAGGMNTARLSFDLGRALSAHCRTSLVELPCLGIPRLGFLSGVKDRDNHTEAALLELDKKGRLLHDYSCKAGENLAVLAANIYAVPDYPITLKIELETMMAFPKVFAQYARSLGYPVIVFECQGQLTTPMSFFALQLADTVLVPVDEAGEITFSLLNIRRLVHVFRLPPQKFRIITDEEPVFIENLLRIKDEEGKDLAGVSVGGADMKDIIRYLGKPGTRGTEEDVLKEDQKEDQSAQLKNSRVTIRL